MATILDYVRWRGDLHFTQDAFQEIDALVFSALSYVFYGGRAEKEPEKPLTLQQAARDFFEEGNCENRVRVKTDLELLQIAADSVRFGQSKLFMYRNCLIPEQETQFAAMTFLLDDNTIFIAFRGTDGSLVGWKEDFNMTFQQSIPAQRLALQYVRDIALERSEPIRMGGHSKGGNLAVFAASRSSPMIQEQIIEVYNNDGPGFTKYMMGDPGYLAVVERIHTFIPQSSVIGMLLEHEEPYTVVCSKAVGVLQHDLYTWELMGNHFITVDAVTQDSLFLDAMIKNWFSSMSNQERNQFVDAVYALLSSSGADSPGDILQLHSLKTYIRKIREDEGLRKLLSTELNGLVDSAKKAYMQMELEKMKLKLGENAKKEAIDSADQLKR